MEILSKHIEYLLLRHDCVIVPGIGAFINIYHPPTFDCETGKLLPPRVEIVFNASLKSDDGLLANSYSRKDKLTYRVGSELLARDIKSLSDILNTEREVTFGRLGILRQEKEGNIRFVPFKTSEALASSLGLYSVEAMHNNITSENTVDEMALPEGKAEVRKEVSVLDHGQKKRNYGNSKRGRVFNTDKNYYIPVNKLFTKICAAFLIIGFMTLTCLNLPRQANQNEEHAAILPMDKVIDTAVQHFRELSKDSEDRKEESIDLDEKTTIETEQTPRYYLIVATCTAMDEAERFVAKKKETGYKLTILPSSKYIRVSAGEDSDRNLLIEKMQTPEFKSSFAESWVMKEK